MIEQLDFAASLVYSPRGESEVSRRSRAYRSALKRADPQFLQKAAARVAQQVQEGEFPQFFGQDVTLVPVPGSAPRRDSTTLWVAESLAQALRARGLAAGIWASLRRVTAVQKSAYAVPGGRPSVEIHVDSLRVTDMLAPTTRILLVDDFVTKGRTLLASATALQAAVPGIEIRAYALFRTMGFQPDIERIVEPAVGTINWTGDADREP